MADNTIKKTFPKPPDWEKVERAVTDMLVHFEKMSHIEKYNTIILLQTTVDREFNIITLIDWLTKMQETEQNIDIGKLKEMTQYG